MFCFWVKKKQLVELTSSRNYLVWPSVALSVGCHHAFSPNLFYMYPHCKLVWNMMKRFLSCHRVAESSPLTLKTTTNSNFIVTKEWNGKEFWVPPIKSLTTPTLENEFYMELICWARNEMKNSKLWWCQVAERPLGVECSFN